MICGRLMGKALQKTLSENVSEVSTQISDSDTPKNMEDQIIYIAEPIASDIQASLKTTEISHETIETKTNASSFFSDRTIVRSMKKKTKRKFNPPFLAGNLSKNKNQGIMKASEAKKLKTNATQCQTGKCANLSKVNKAELKTVKIKSTKVKTTEVKKEQI